MQNSFFAHTIIFYFNHVEFQTHISESKLNIYEQENIQYSTCNTRPHNWQPHVQSTSRYCCCRRHRCFDTSKGLPNPLCKHQGLSTFHNPHRQPLFGVCSYPQQPRACAIVAEDWLGVLGDKCFPNLQYSNYLYELADNNADQSNQDLKTIVDT